MVKKEGRVTVKPVDQPEVLRVHTSVLSSCRQWEGKASPLWLLCQEASCSPHQPCPERGLPSEGDLVQGSPNPQTLWKEQNEVLLCFLNPFQGGKTPRQMFLEK